MSDAHSTLSSRITDKHSSLTVSRLREVLSYNHESGEFIWKMQMSNAAPKAGAVAGNKDDVTGYIRIGIEGRLYIASRLAWFYVHGEWPSAEIDHRNRDRADNRLNNLRPASRLQNNRHSGKRAQTRSGFKGVAFRELSGGVGSWRARIKLNGKDHSIGYFDTPEKAARAYDEAAKVHYGQFAVLNYPEVPVEEVDDVGTC